MFADQSPGWGLAQSAISAAAGLGGVFVGAWMTSRNQKRDRLNALYRQQLQEFYSPMLGMMDEIKAKDASQKIVMEKADKLRKENASRPSSESTEELMKVFRYSSSQWIQEIFPLFIKMSTYFTDHIWLAEQSTREHYQRLVHCIEIWKRQQSSALTADLSCELTFSDDEFVPLYDNLNANFERLRRLIQKT